MSVPDHCLSFNLVCCRFSQFPNFRQEIGAFPEDRTVTGTFGETSGGSDK